MGSLKLDGRFSQVLSLSGGRVACSFADGTLTLGNVDPRASAALQIAPGGVGPKISTSEGAGAEDDSPKVPRLDVNELDHECVWAYIPS